MGHIREDGKKEKREVRGEDEKCKKGKRRLEKNWKDGEGEEKVEKNIQKKKWQIRRDMKKRRERCKKMAEWGKDDEDGETGVEDSE